MAYYRLYFLDGLGRIREFREFEAVTDACAIAQAEDWRELAAMELWSGRRKLMAWASAGLSVGAAAPTARIAGLGA